MSWLEDNDNLRLWHESGWWARLCFRAANFWIRCSRNTLHLVLRAARWQSDRFPFSEDRKLHANSRTAVKAGRAVMRSPKFPGVRHG